MELLLGLIFTLAVNSAVGVENSHLEYKDFKTRVIHGRIYGGVNATKGQFPFIVSLQHLPDNNPFCGGSLLTMRYLLTAAHCVLNSVDVEAVAGKHVMGVVEDTEQRRMIVQSYKHENFSESPGPYDLAIQKVSSPFKCGLWVKTISLPKFQAIPEGWADVAGWGVLEGDGEEFPEFPLILQRTVLEVIPFNQCLVQLPDGAPLHGTNICTTSPNRSATCPGDSGGPLVQDDVLIGVVSWGVVPCGEWNMPSVFVDVAQFVDWIIGIIPTLVNPRPPCQ